MQIEIESEKLLFQSWRKLENLFILKIEKKKTLEKF